MAGGPAGIQGASGCDIPPLGWSSGGAWGECVQCQHQLVPLHLCQQPAIGELPACVGHLLPGVLQQCLVQGSPGSCRYLLPGQALPPAHMTLNRPGDRCVLLRRLTCCKAVPVIKHVRSSHVGLHEQDESLHTLVISMQRQVSPLTNATTVSADGAFSNSTLIYHPRLSACIDIVCEPASCLQARFGLLLDSPEGTRCA